jgi:hypothetical protein
MAASRARVAASSPKAVSSFVNARDKSELRKRMATFRTFLDLIAESIGPGSDPYTAPLCIAVAMHFGVVALLIDPAIVAVELGKRQGADIPAIVEEGFALARAPASFLFVPGEGASA